MCFKESFIKVTEVTLEGDSSDTFNFKNPFASKCLGSKVIKQFRNN